jgi:hypothetical protein
MAEKQTHTTLKQMTSATAAEYLVSQRMSPIEHVSFKAGVMDVPQGAEFRVRDLVGLSPMQILD